MAWYDPKPEDIEWSPKAKRKWAAVMAIRNGTKARLISQHKGPNKERTPGADYGPKNQDDLDKAFQETHDHAINQWQAGDGVVGPSGSEGWFPGFNDPDKTSYESNQNFAYQHDMQATDAELQALTPEQKKAYKWANIKSAAEGMWVLKRTGDLNKALAKTQQVFGDAGFKVGTNYSK